VGRRAPSMIGEHSGEGATNVVGILPRSPTRHTKLLARKPWNVNNTTSISSTSLLDLAKGQGELARTIDSGPIRFFVPHDWITVGGDFLETVDLRRGHDKRNRWTCSGDFAEEWHFVLVLVKVGTIPVSCPRCCFSFLHPSSLCCWVLSLDRN